MKGGAGRGILRRVVLSLVAVALALGGVRALARSRIFQLFGRLVPRVETSEKAVALTFDDGPTAEHVGEILSVLEAEAAHATFFVNGSNLAEDPEPARRLVAGGHELGNHTFSHARMILKAQATYATEITRTDDLIRRAGHQGEIFFRAPFTWKLVGLPFFLARTGRTTITFDVEPETYPETAKSATAIEAHVLGVRAPGVHRPAARVVLGQRSVAGGASRHLERPPLPGLSTADPLRAASARGRSQEENMTTNGALLAFTFGLCVSGPAFAEAPPAARPEAVGVSCERLGRLTRSARETVESGKLAGLVTLVARGGRIAHLEAVGEADREATWP